jgi:predicted nucleic acid-binding protein
MEKQIEKEILNYILRTKAEDLVYNTKELAHTIHEMTIMPPNDGSSSVVGTQVLGEVINVTGEKDAIRRMKVVNEVLLENIDKNISPLGKLVSVTFANGEAECWFREEKGLARYPVDLVEEALNKEIEKRLSKEYFNKF